MAEEADSRLLTRIAQFLVPYIRRIEAHADVR
jgi:hypothetical protein